MPATISSGSELKAVLAEALRARSGDGAACIGFVPTMGALHAGHVSLIERAARECAVVVVSIFVNPTQFGPDEDFTRYPRDIDADLRVACGAGATLVFVPAVEEIYPEGLEGVKGTYNLTHLGARWEGAARPGHFEGVALVVTRLLKIVNPDKAYFGEKDYQQLRVVSTLVSDLNIPTEIVACPTIRDRDGLALSSRNRYLDEAQRRAARSIALALEAAQALAKQGETCATKLESAARSVLDTSLVVDYLAVVDALTLEPCPELSSTHETRLLLAVTCGTTRLIDNAPLSCALGQGDGSGVPPASLPH